MTGGQLQLVTHGVQDIYITGDPEITFFKTVFRRHTNFSRGEFDLPFEGTLNFGQESKLKLAKFGDLIHRLHLHVTLPEINVTYTFLTVSEVVKILADYGITWVTDRPPNSIFDQSAYDEVVPLIDQKIIDLNAEIEQSRFFIDLLNTQLSPTQFFEDNPTATQADVQEYFDYVVQLLITFDKYAIEYAFVNAQNIDTTTPLPLATLPIVQNTMFQDFLTYATTLSLASSLLTFNDENLVFYYNTDTANYNIGGSANQNSANTVFRAGINNAYGPVPYAFLDAYHIFDQILNTQSSNINSNFDVQVIKQILLNNERYGLLLNPLQLTNVYNSLGNDAKFMFYKKLQRLAPGVYTPSDDFVNISLIQSLEPEFNDNFTSDFPVMPLPGQPSDVNHPYGTFVNNAVTQFHDANKSAFRTSVFVNYFNDYTLWTRFNIGAPGNPLLDSFSMLCIPDIIGFYGSVPNTLIGMYFLNYIPLFTANDFPIAVQRVMNKKIADGDPNAVLIAAFLPALLFALNVAATTSINAILPVICVENNYDTIIKMSGFRTTDGTNGDVEHCSVIRLQDYLILGGQKVLYMDYVRELFLQTLNSFAAAGYALELPTLLATLDLFYYPVNDVPVYSTYLAFAKNFRSDLRINFAGQPVLCDAPSSIWYSIQHAVLDDYNSLYSNQVLSPTYFSDTLGAEMSLYLTEITNMYFSPPINYWFDTPQPLLPINGGAIGVYLANKFVDLTATIAKYDANRKLLNMNNLIISNNLYYFAPFIDIVNQIVTHLETDVDVNGDYVYQHEPHNAMVSDPLDPVVQVYNALTDPFDPNYIVSDPHNTALDIFIKVANLFFLLITQLANPFPVSQPNKRALWFQLWTPTKTFDTPTEDANYTTLFTNTPYTNIPVSKINPTFLFSQLTLIDVTYGGFLNELDVYRYMKDVIVKASILAPLFPLKGADVDATNQLLIQYYQVHGVELNIQLNRIVGTETSPGLEQQLANSLQGGQPANFAWDHKLGHYMIERVDIKIGGQLIDRHYGEWLEIWHELTKKTSKQKGYNQLIGDVPELTTFNKIKKKQYELYIPLQFWFCKYLGCALPMIGLLNTEVEIIVKLRTFEELSYRDTFTIVKRAPLQCKLLTEYIYIEQTERSKFAKSKLEYLIDYVQMSDVKTLAAGQVTGILNEPLYFENSARELIWVVQDKSMINGSLPLGERRWDNYGIVNPLVGAQIKFSATVRELFKPIEHYDTVFPGERHHSDKRGINVYSFAWRPELYQINGAANLGVLEDVVLEYKLTNDVITNIANGAEYRLVVYALTHNVLRVMSGQGALAFFK